MILDTNALSDIVTGKMDKRILGTERHCLPVVVMGEYRFGVLGSRDEDKLQVMLDRAIRIFRVLDITQDTAVHYAGIRLELKQVGRPIPENDIWIASLARQHNLEILSKDKHFDVVPGLIRRDW